MAEAELDYWAYNHSNGQKWITMALLRKWQKEIKNQFLRRNRNQKRSQYCTHTKGSQYPRSRTVLHSTTGRSQESSSSVRNKPNIENSLVTKKWRQPCAVTIRGIVLAHSVRPLLNLILIYLCKNMSLVIHRSYRRNLHIWSMYICTRYLHMQESDNYTGSCEIPASSSHQENQDLKCA